MLKKLTLVFILAFIINWVWEVLHGRLYLHYQGGPITGFVLLRAALADAAIILVLVFAAQKFKLNKSQFVIFGGLAAAVIIEAWALPTGRWAYNSLMPIVPIIKIGLTPTIQLAVTGYVVQKLVFRNSGKKNC